MLRGSFNSYVDVDVAGLARHTLGGQVSQRCRWNPATEQFDASCQWSGGASNSTIGRPCGPSGVDENGVTCDEPLRLPRTWEYTLGAEREVVTNLASVTSLLLLCVFTIVNIACLVLRRDGRESMFRSPGPTPAFAAAASAFLIGPWVDRDGIVYEIAGGLLLIGVVLWALTWLTNRGVRAKKTGFRDIDHLDA